MPFLKLRTNIAIDQPQSEQLLSELSRLIAKETGKPERYVMVELSGGNAMLFGGNNQPLAYLECKSIGLNAALAKALAASISKLLTATLPLSADRIYIEFSDCPAEFWGWNQYCSAQFLSNNWKHDDAPNDHFNCRFSRRLP